MNWLEKANEIKGEQNKIEEFLRVQSNCWNRTWWKPWQHLFTSYGAMQCELKMSPELAVKVREVIQAHNEELEQHFKHAVSMLNLEQQGVI